MLKIEKIKEKIKNFDNSDSLCCYLAQMVTNKGDKNNCSRKNTTSCRQCLKLSLMDLLEEYKEPYELTVLEFRILRYARELGYRFVACDFDGEICFYRNKPDKKEIAWSDGGDFSLIFNFGLFSFIKWEDAEPWNIDNILANCEVIGDEKS